MQLVKSLRLVFFSLPSQQLNEYLPSTTFWISHSHGCLPFSPPVRALISSLTAHRVQPSNLSALKLVDEHRISPARARALSAGQFVRKKKASIAGLEPTASTSIVKRLTIDSEPPGTPGILVSYDMISKKTCVKLMITWY